MVLAVMLVLLYAVLVCYYGWGFAQQATYNAPPAHVLPRLAVVVPARNEAEHIVRCLQHLAAQHYPAECWQVVVIDDHSADNTADLVRQFAEQHPALRLSLLSLADYLPANAPLNSYKKKAIELAIAHTHTEWIVTTDADSYALSPWWLASLMGYAQQHNCQMLTAPVVLSPAHVSGVGGVLWAFQALDMAGMMAVTAVSLRHGWADMGNGANLAYRRAAFEQVSGFAGIDHLASGDDMLLLAKIKQRYPHGVGFVKSAAAIVATAPQATWAALARQRLRWASKSGAYKGWATQAVLLCVWAVNVLCSLLPLVAWWQGSTLLWGGVVVCWLLKAAADGYMLYVATHFFGVQHALRWWVVVQPLHQWYIAVVGIAANLLPNYTWKGRTVR